MSSENVLVFNKQQRRKFRTRNSRHLGISNRSRDVSSTNQPEQSIATTTLPSVKRRRYSSRINRNRRSKLNEQLAIDPNQSRLLPPSCGTTANGIHSDVQQNSASVRYQGSAVKGSSQATVNGGPAGPSKRAAADTDPLSRGSTDTVAKRGRRRSRRAPKRKWKPYFKLTNEERRLLEIREEKRAERIRAQRFKSGLPVAPYNTTQFLFNDLQARGGGGPLADEPVVDVDRIVESIRHHHRSESNDRDSVSASIDGSHANQNNADNGSESGSASYTDLFNEKEFDYEYDSAFAERLSSLSKEDLIKDYLELEKQYERGQSDLMIKDKEITELRERIRLLEQQHSGHVTKCKESPASPKNG